MFSAKGKSNGGFLFNRINMWSLTPAPAGGNGSKQKTQITNILCSHALWGTSLWSQTYIPTFSGSAYGQHRYTVATPEPRTWRWHTARSQQHPSNVLHHLQQPVPVPELMKKRHPNRWSTLLPVSFYFLIQYVRTTEIDQRHGKTYVVCTVYIHCFGGESAQR